MMKLKTFFAAAALMAASSPAMAASFITDPITPYIQSNGVDYWGVQVLPFSSLDQTFNFNLTSDSKIDLFMQGTSKILFTDVLLNGTSIASNFRVGNNAALVASAYALNGPTTLRFIGDYNCSNCYGDWFGGYVKVVRGTAPNATAAVPEPSSWALMISGFGLVGFSLRRKRQHMSMAQAG